MMANILRTTVLLAGFLLLTIMGQPTWHSKDVPKCDLRCSEMNIVLNRLQDLENRMKMYGKFLC